MTSRQLDLIRQCQALAGRVRATGKPQSARIGHGGVIGFPELGVLDHVYGGGELPSIKLHLPGVVLVGLPSQTMALLDR